MLFVLLTSEVTEHDRNPFARAPLMRFSCKLVPQVELCCQSLGKGSYRSRCFVSSAAVFRFSAVATRQWTFRQT